MGGSVFIKFEVIRFFTLISELCCFIFGKQNLAKDGLDYLLLCGEHAFLKTSCMMAKSG